MLNQWIWSSLICRYVSQRDAQRISLCCDGTRTQHMHVRCIHVISNNTEAMQASAPANKDPCGAAAAATRHGLLDNSVTDAFYSSADTKTIQDAMLHLPAQSRTYNRTHCELHIVCENDLCACLNWLGRLRVRHSNHAVGVARLEHRGLGVPWLLVLQAAAAAAPTVISTSY
jgi:hypothetical protein